MTKRIKIQTWPKLENILKYSFINNQKVFGETLNCIEKFGLDIPVINADFNKNKSFSPSKIGLTDNVIKNCIINATEYVKGELKDEYKHSLTFSRKSFRLAEKTITLSLYNTLNNRFEFFTIHFNTLFDFESIDHCHIFQYKGKFYIDFVYEKKIQKIIKSALEIQLKKASKSKRVGFNVYLDDKTYNELKQICNLSFKFQKAVAKYIVNYCKTNKKVPSFSHLIDVFEQTEPFNELCIDASQNIIYYVLSKLQKIVREEVVEINKKDLQNGVIYSVKDVVINKGKLVFQKKKENKTVLAKSEQYNEKLLKTLFNSRREKEKEEEEEEEEEVTQYKIMMKRKRFILLLYIKREKFNKINKLAN
jgi:hypothetical protein